MMCIDTNCSSELDACTPQGTNSCSAILGCIQSCAGNQTCGLSCIESGTAAAQDLFIAIEECLVEQCPNTQDQMCVQTAIGPSGACAGNISACQQDR